MTEHMAGMWSHRKPAHQNVVLGHGYFLGALGRNRVFPFYPEVANFDMPSDYSGLVFMSCDAGGRDVRLPAADSGVRPPGVSLA